MMTSPLLHRTDCRRGRWGAPLATFARGRGHTSVGQGARPGWAQPEGGGGQSGLHQHFGSYLCKKKTPAFPAAHHTAPLASARSAHVTSAPTNAHASSPGAMACEVPGVIPRARRAGSLRPCQAARGLTPEKRGPRGKCGSWWPRLGNVHRSTTKVPRKMPSTAHPCRAQHTQREVSGTGVRSVSKASCAETHLGLSARVATIVFRNVRFSGNESTAFPRHLLSSK
jgi:hypothetical protein